MAFNLCVNELCCDSYMAALILIKLQCNFMDICTDMRPGLRVL